MIKIKVRLDLTMIFNHYLFIFQYIFVNEGNYKDQDI